MKRFDAIKKIVPLLKDELVVCNLGAPSRELFHIKDRNENFYMLGSMGLASSIAFGIAISRPERRIWCIDGDGSILMNLGSLSTIANNHPHNLTLIIIDNSTYGSTGDQKTYTNGKTKLDIIAKGAGFSSILIIDREEDITEILKKISIGCHFVLIKVKPGNAPVENVPLHPEEIKKRFRNAILIDK
ncbi:MAG: sulfopyruvate decarboxylase subunit beta [Promethearchaeota archaeon]|nr:MAG: sulfopyruvate decarboxylase subunit beta [Candidatus Lokiarchaeota archaeon]